MEANAISPSSINFGYHLVVYIDLPGQRRELEAIRHVPQTHAEKQATILAIDRSAMRVHAIRSDLTHQARTLMQINPEVLKQLADQSFHPGIWPTPTPGDRRIAMRANHPCQ
jgi:hypothetical protein